MSIAFKYQLEGKAADNQTWKATGAVRVANLGEFPSVSHKVMEDAFEQLTRGQAVYGKPGLGCRGPYRITRMLIELADGA